MTMSPRHISNLQAIRLAAAYLVLIRHSLILFGEHNPLPEWTTLPVGIWVFFAISGYLLPSSWARNPRLLPYLSNRARRLFPALFAVVLGSAFIVGPLSTRLPVLEYVLHPMTWEYLLNLALHPYYFLPGVFESNFYPSAVNGSLWSIPPQFLSYLLIPIVFLAPWRNIRIPLWAALFVGALWADSTGNFSGSIIWGNDFSQAFAALALFAMGAFLREVRVPFTLPIAALATLALVGGITFAPTAAHLWLAAFLPYVTLTIGLRSWPILRRANELPDISYAVFLLGFPVQQILISYNPGLHPAASILACVVFTTVLAMCVERFVERPVQSRWNSNNGSAQLSS